MTTRLPLPLIALVALLVAACGGTASPRPQPTPTPIVAEVETPQDAAALVIATDPLFTGSMELTPDLIGGSSYWEAESLADGGYQITQTVGWGDCPAGCINRHVWVFEVSADGQVELIEESGDPIPADGIPSF